MFQWKIYSRWYKEKIKGNGGLVAYLNTNDGREVEAMIEAGNEKLS